MGTMKKTELKPKVVSLVLVALLLCSIFTGAVGTVADMVSSANGNLYLSEKDISIKAQGFDIEIIRSYNSHNSGINSPFGFGWTYNYNLGKRCLKTEIIEKINFIK